MKSNVITTGALILSMLLLIAFAQPAISQDTDSEQQQQVEGSVVDGVTGEPLAGVNILIKGTVTGTATDGDGYYSLAVPSLTDTLVFSYVSYESQEIPIDGRTEIDVEMQPDEVALDDIVVVGYGTQRAENIAGSISRANAEDLERISTPTVAQSLQGQTAGVFIKNRNAQPGENKTDINIRGFGEPLFIVDGQPVDESVFQELNSNDIAELNVLKDAAAAAVYGARAGNGVVVVETKRGIVSDPQFSYESEAAVQFLLPSAIPEGVNSHEWMELRNMVAENEGRSLPFSREQIELHREHADGSAPVEYPNSDVFDLVLRDYAPMTQQDLSVRGGTERIRYFVSGGWVHQRGILASDEISFNRYSLRSNVDIALTERLDLRLDVSGNIRDYIGPRNQLEGESWGQGQGIMARMVRWRPFYPTAPLPDPDLPRGAPAGQTINPVNATYISNVGYIDWIGQYADAKATLEYDLPYGFSTRAIFNYTRDDLRHKLYQKRGPEYGYNEETGEHEVVRYINAISEVRQRDEIERNINLQYFLEWDQTLAQDHRIDAMLVAERLSTTFDGFQAWRQNYDFDIDQLFAGPDESQFNNNEPWRDGRLGFIGRLNYNYAGKYTLEVSSRLDGSPQFPPGKRWGFFPSASAAWQVAEEPFISDNASLSFLDRLTLRASYGRLGYDAAGDFQYLSTYSFGQPYIYSGNTVQRGLESDGLPNPNITWEEMDLANIGIEFNLWDGMLEGAVDVFQRDRRNVLGVRIRDIPNVVGAEMPEENYQEYRNRGLEVMLNHSNELGGLRYSLGSNVSYNREKTIYIDEPDFSNKESERRNSRIGKWTNSVWMYPSDGLFQSEEEIRNWADIDGQSNASIQPGDVRYVDTNGDGRITPADMTIVGSGNTPRLDFGFNTSLGWRGFDFFMQWQGSGMYGFNLRSSEYAQPWSSDGTPLQHHLNDSYVEEGNEWRPANTDARWPRLRLSPRGPSYAFNVDQWWIDGTYVRLRQAQLSYSLPSNMINWMGLTNLSVYIAGYNLITFSALDFMDPEIDTDPEQFFGNYHPQMGSYHLGFDVSF